MTGLPMKYVRHTIVLKICTVCLSCKKKNWLYFIGKLFELSEKKNDFDFDHFGTEADIDENDFLLDISTNLQACEPFHNNL